MKSQKRASLQMPRNKNELRAEPTSQPMIFDPAGLGRSLQEVGADLIETSDGSSVLSRWFQSARDVELLIWVDSEKNIIKHQITFFGQVVEWTKHDGIKTGVVIEEESTLSQEQALRETIRFDQSADRRAVETAILVVESVPSLSDQDLDRIRQSLKPLNLRESAVRQTKWDRLRRWFSGT